MQWSNISLYRYDKLTWFDADGGTDDRPEGWRCQATVLGWVHLLAVEIGPIRREHQRAIAQDVPATHHHQFNQTKHDQLSVKSAPILPVKKIHSTSASTKAIKNKEKESWSIKINFRIFFFFFNQWNIIHNPKCKSDNQINKPNQVAMNLDKGQRWYESSASIQLRKHNQALIGC